jgi:hydroxymethylbilane synthase
MPQKYITIATRKSPLALWQANYIKKCLLTIDASLDVPLLPIVTQGDKLLQTSLVKIGGKGLFVKELEKALLTHRADIAVHSMKDVPIESQQGLTLAAICKRESPFDALVNLDKHTLDSLPAKAIIGTSSLRRQCQIKAYRPDLEVKNLRGNVNTRLNKLKIGDFDAIILAQAGLERLALENTISEILPKEIMLPACGQGALGIEMRTDDTRLRTIIDKLNHKQSADCVTAERLVNEKLGGNCQVPISVYCYLNYDNDYVIEAKVAHPNGNIVYYTKRQGSYDSLNALALACASDLIAKGAKELINSL